jgi:hypothetical protein
MTENPDTEAVTSSVAGSPWQDIRLHAKLNPGDGRLLVEFAHLRILGRPFTWTLTGEGAAALLIPISRDSDETIPQGSASLEIQRKWAGGDPWIRVVCRERSLEDIFLRFAYSVIEELQNGKLAHDALSSTLERYRELFLIRQTGISRERVLGLVGELLVLEHLLSGGLDALMAWRGPAGETHDFQFPGAHIEVKAGSAAGETRVRISNLHQLDCPDGGQLFLVYVGVASGGNDTVETLSRRILELLDGTGRSRYMSELRELGCVDFADQEWNSFRFSLQRIDVWNVEEGFPRLVPAMLPGGHAPESVRDVSYTVSLENAEQFRISLPTLTGRIREASRGVRS